MNSESDLAAISDDDGDATADSDDHITSRSSNASPTSVPSVISSTSATSGVIAYGSGVHSDINFKIVVNDGKSGIISHHMFCCV